MGTDTAQNLRELIQEYIHKLNYNSIQQFNGRFTIRYVSSQVHKGHEAATVTFLMEDHTRYASFQTKEDFVLIDGEALGSRIWGTYTDFIENRLKGDSNETRKAFNKK